MTDKSRTYFITFSHVSSAGSGCGSMTVITPDGLMTPKRLDETIERVKERNLGKDIVLTGIFPLDREPTDDTDWSVLGAKGPKTEGSTT